MTQRSARAGGVGARFDEAAKLGIVQPMRFFACTLAVAFLPLPALAALPAAPESQLTGQDTVYTLTLSKLRTHDITGATGRLQLQMVDGCTGWASHQQMTVIIRNVDGSLSKSVSDYTTWESKNGKMLTFSVSQGDGSGAMKVVDSGTATHTGPDDRGVVKFNVPAGLVVSLPAGTLFPMQHTEALLAAAKDRKVFISPLLFDGTSTDGASPTFVTIFGYQQPAKTSWPALSGYASANVSIAFFPRTNQDSTPDFSTSMRYFENGVTTNLVLDFGDFVMNGKLVSLNIPKSACPVPSPQPHPQTSALK